jgi:hypothetical protein
MNDLTPGFELKAGQVICTGLTAGAAGEAFLTPFPGLDLAFDRADGRLCRAVVQTVASDGSVAVNEQVAAILTKLFGPAAPAVVLGATTSPGRAPRMLSPQPGLTDTLSSLARLSAIRSTSPVSPGSPSWGDEATELAARAGLPALAGPMAAAPSGGSPPAPVQHVAAEAENLRRHRGPSGLQWLLDPGAVPEGVFQLGLSPRSDLAVWREGRPGRIVIEASLAPGAVHGALGGCQARLVDPGIRRILAQAAFTVSGNCARAELRLPFLPRELPECWAEVVRDRRDPVRSTAGHRIRRALRWADAALRAERAPAGLDPAASADDWSALAEEAWNQCSLDWAAGGDTDRAYLAALAAGRRRTAGEAMPAVGEPSPTADKIARQVPRPGPACLAEVRGR